MVIISNRIGKEPYINDEISWYFHTEFFDKAFISHEYSNQSWETYEGYDQPQLAKYFFGWCLNSSDKNYSITRNELVTRYGRWQFYFNQKLIDSLKTSEFAPVIARMRQCNSGMVLIGIIGVFLLSVLVSNNFFIGLGIVLFIVFNNLFLTVLLRATNDALWFAASVWSINLYVLFNKTNNRKFFTITWLLSGISLSTKLTGLLPLAGLYLYHSITDKKVLTIILPVILISCIWVLVNPTLWHNPAGNTVEYLVFRSRQSVIFQEYFTQASLPNVSDKIYAVFHFFTQSWIACIFMIIGLRSLVINRNIFLLFMTGITMLLGTLMLPMDWDRYYLPFYIPLTILLSAGVREIVYKLYP